MMEAETDREQLIAITKSIPELAGNGIGVFPGSRNETLEERQAKFQEDRETMLNPHERTVESFTVSKAWILKNVEARDKLTRRYGTSYGVKHHMSRDTGVYVNNGTFIAAMVACGYRWKRVVWDSPNAIFNWYMKPRKQN